MSFEERLLDELKRDAVLRDVARVPVRRRVVRRGLLAGAVCAAVAVGWAVLPTSSDSAAYAVEKNSDGSVTLSVKEAGGEEVALRLVSVPEEIRRGGMAVDVASGTCADDPGDPMPEWVENTTGPDKAVRKYLAWKVTLKSEGVAPYVVWVREDDGKFVPCVPDKS
ncbi:hypothetical protein IAG44_22745 [Streptomyces roseirectus]|uniref:Uncharacterized protein n=1 Tax=Streptomyces roseirectus TaxID=2768066 RepID=A0A7H0IGN8_9ACTN|nr:hypothetical protein [Streptomyces roseirectus]QNP71954.1 hypothetical protein IAG44_22745 [Streptomyces roseirectus]